MESELLRGLSREQGENSLEGSRDRDGKNFGTIDNVVGGTGGTRIEATRSKPATINHFGGSVRDQPLRVEPERGYYGEPFEVHWSLSLIPAGNGVRYAKPSEWIGIFPEGRSCPGNKCFVAYSSYLPPKASSGIAKVHIPRSGKFVARLCSGRNGFMGYQCRRLESLPFSVSACADAKTVWVDVGSDAGRGGGAAVGKSVAIPPFCTMTFVLTGHAALRRLSVNTYVAAHFTHGKAHANKKQSREENEGGERRSSSSRRGALPSLSIFTDGGDRSRAGDTLPRSVPVSVYDVVATPVASLTEPDIVVTVVSNEPKDVSATLHATVSRGCVAECRHGYCDVAEGSCVCEPGYFGSACSMTHSAFMRRHAPLRPMVLVPGLAGSRLVARDRVTGARERCWIDMPTSLRGAIERTKRLEADRNIRRFLVGSFDPETGTVTGTTSGREWEVFAPRDRYGLEAIEDLIPDAGPVTALLRAMHKTEYFGPLVRRLEAAGYRRGVDLFGFPYDWRESTRAVRLVDEFRDMIRDIRRSTGRRVEVVSHSMGGLLVRSYLALYGEEAEANLASWVAIATPFQGASGAALKAFLVGHRFKNPFVSLATARSLAVGMPSAYELLPAEDAGAGAGSGAFRWSPEPEVEFTLEDSDGKRTANRVRMVDAGASLLPEALRCQSIREDGHEYPRGFSREAASWANDTRYLWRFADPSAASLRFFNVYGLTKRDTTPHSFTYADPVRSMCDLAGRKPSKVSKVAGDGTVPAQSARADGMRATERILVPSIAGHVDMVRDPRIARLVRSLTGTDCSFEGVWAVAGPPAAAGSPSGAGIGTSVSLYQFGDHVYGHLGGGRAFVGHGRRGSLEGIVVEGASDHADRNRRGAGVRSRASSGRKPASTSSYLSGAMEAHCLAATLSWRNSTDFAVIEEVTLDRVIGDQCLPGQAVPCRVPHGHGLRGCHYGYWSTECRVSRCTGKDRCMRVEHKLGAISCGSCSKDVTASGGDVESRAESVCGLDKPFLCLDGSCSVGIEGCLSRHRRPSWSSASHLPGGDAAPAEPMCPPERPILCSTRSCVRVLSHCDREVRVYEDREAASEHRLPGFKCPRPSDKVVCPNGSCARTREECNAHFNTLKEGTPACTGAFCPSTGKCVLTLADCEPFGRALGRLGRVGFISDGGDRSEDDRSGDDDDSSSSSDDDDEDEDDDSGGGGGGDDDDDGSSSDDNDSDDDDDDDDSGFGASALDPVLDWIASNRWLAVAVGVSTLTSIVATVTLFRAWRARRGRRHESEYSSYQYQPLSTLTDDTSMDELQRSRW